MPAADPFEKLGVTLTPSGGELRVWSERATSVELCLFDEHDPKWAIKTVPLKRGEHGVWQASSRELKPGRRYSIRVGGPGEARNSFDPQTQLLDPYARAIVCTGAEEWRSVVVEDAFDWGGVTKPNTPLDRTVAYEAHLKGLTRLNTRVPPALRGTYAGLAHESTIAYLKDLGVTAVELLPVQAFASETRLLKQGRSNYWGYNTLGYFAPHAAYATRAAQTEGPAAVLRELKGMVRLLHEAGIEVLLDVVYNHTAEEGRDGPRSSFRGIDNAGYYRQNANGDYVDFTGCGNTLDFSQDAVHRLALDSLRYWASEVQIDGFRFDLAVTLGRDRDGTYSPEHPLLNAIGSDPVLADAKIIAEPWDIGPGGWQTGNFPGRWSEWNDRFRDRVRDFWLTDLAAIRSNGLPDSNVGTLAQKLSGSSHLFAHDRGTLASVNFVTAHDGFPLADLTAYNHKHNQGNGESNRDGSDNNHSFNFGVEGDTRSAEVLGARRRAMRNLLGTLLLSAGVPMLTAGDEYGRSQRGNNNAYCHDSKLSWLPWEHSAWQDELFQVTRKLIRLREENPALRPVRVGVSSEVVPDASELAWFGASGAPMQDHDWRPDARTVQYLATSTPRTEARNRTLLVVHGSEQDAIVTLPAVGEVLHYRLLWDSADDAAEDLLQLPGSDIHLDGPSLRLFRAE